MRYLGLATDYDGTLATHGRVDIPTLEAIDAVRTSGRRVLLVTGRELADLERVFPHLDSFDRIVAENGAVLYTPASRQRRVLGPAPMAAFVAELQRRGVTPLSVGDCIVATWQPHEATVLDVIRELGLELQVIFNKGAVMVLPPGINKASGLEAALADLALSAHNVVAIGDAENDHALLESAELSVAVANAVPMLKAAADLVTQGDHGAGVIEVAQGLLRDDLASITLRRPRHRLLLGTQRDGQELFIPSQGSAVMVAGSSGSGKSTLSTTLLEQLLERGYQCCVIDPEGDYDELPEAIHFGTAKRAPELAEILTAIDRPDASLVVNLLGIPVRDRPAFFAGLLSRLQELRAKTGRPHWMLIDEAHHLLPVDWQNAPAVLAQELTSVIYVTVHPQMVAPAILEKLDVIAALGRDPHAVFTFLDGKAPAGDGTLDTGEALVWIKGQTRVPVKVIVAPSTIERRRHRRKYATGELGPDRSFFFRGADGRLNLRAQNLSLFVQLADGVDDATWRHHLERGDYSRWIDDCVKDQELATRVREAEQEAKALSPTESRARIREAIEELYTLPETGLQGNTTASSRRDDARSAR